MNSRDMKKQVRCTTCRMLKDNMFDVCSPVDGVNTHDRCPLMIDTPVLALQYTTDEDYDRFVSGIKRI